MHQSTESPGGGGGGGGWAGGWGVAGNGRAVSGLSCLVNQNAAPQGGNLLVERRYRPGHGAGIVNTTQILLMPKSYLLYD